MKGKMEGCRMNEGWLRERMKEQAERYSAKDPQQWEGYFPAVLEICRRIKEDPVQIVAVDGRCGSGKTCFAKWLGELFSCNVFHMDDFYLPLERRPKNWENIPGGNMDFARLQAEVLFPLYAKEPVLYRPYHCRLGRVEMERRMPKTGLSIIEGSYSHHPCLARQQDLKIFLTCSGQVQRKRLQVREGERFSAFEERWIPMEEQYYKYYNIEQNSDFIVNTGC